MKRLGLIIIPLLLMSCLVLQSCSTIGGDKVEYVDKSFISDLKKGLQKRWDIVNDAEENKDNTDEYYKHLEEGVDAELDAVSKYIDASFEDNVLKEKAISYINLLYKQKDTIKYHSSNPDKYNTDWRAAYNNRTKLIEDFTKDYNLTVDKEYQDTLNELLNNSTAVKSDEKLEQAVKDMLSKIEFEAKKENSYSDWATYTGYVENTTGEDINNIQFKIKLLDEDGVILSTQYYWIEGFSKGKKAKIEFSTDEKFKSTEVTAEYY